MYCGQPIDYTLRFPDPGSFSYAHIVPVDARPDLAEDPANGGSAHLKCNQSAGERPARPGLGSTSREW